MGICDGRVVIVTGAGRGFCAGADLSAGGSTFDRSNPEGGEPTLQRDGGGLLTLRIFESRKPVIAAVSGAAAGIGVSYVLASDMVVMGRSAYLKLAFINIGLIPDGGACWHLVRKLGHAQAFEMAALATPMDAERCVALGLANRAVEDDQVLAEARALAQALVAQSPQALGATKRAMRQAANLSLDDTLTLEGALQDECKATEDFHARVAAFRQRRRN